MTMQVVRSIHRIGIVMLASLLVAMPAIVLGASATYEYDTKGRVPLSVSGRSA